MDSSLGESRQPAVTVEALTSVTVKYAASRILYHGYGFVIMGNILVEGGGSSLEVFGTRGYEIERVSTARRWVSCRSLYPDARASIPHFPASVLSHPVQLLDLQCCS